MTPAPPQLLECPCCTVRMARVSVGPDLFAIPTYWSDGKAEDSPDEEVLPLYRCPECNAFFWPGEARIVTQVPEHGCDDPAASVPFARTPRPCEYLEALDVAWKWPHQASVMIRKHLWWAQNDCERRIFHHLEKQSRDSLAAAGLKRMPKKKREPILQLWNKTAKRLDLLRAKYPDMPEQDVAQQLWKQLTAVSLGYFDEARRIHALSCPPRTGPVFRENLEELAASLKPEKPEDRIMLAEIARELGDFKRAHQFLARISDFPASLRRRANALLELTVRQEVAVAVVNPTALSRSA